MKRNVLICTGLLILAMTIAVASNAPAYGTAAAPAPSGSLTVSGKVVSSDPSSLVITTDAGDTMTLAVDSSSTFATAVAAGDRISVQYETASGGKNHVVRVEAGAAEPAPAPAGGSTTSTNGGGEAQTLPHTASPMPLLFGGGLVALALGLGMWRALAHRAA